MYLQTAPDSRYPTANAVDRTYLEFERQIKELATERDIFENDIAPVLSRLSALPSWGDVKSISTYGDHMDLYLNAARKNSPLPREIAREFEVEGKKYANGDTLYVHFAIGDNPIVELDVNGYVPTTCKIVEVEEYVPGEIRMVKKVVCTEELA